MKHRFNHKDCQGMQYLTEIGVFVCHHVMLQPVLLSLSCDSSKGCTLPSLSATTSHLEQSSVYTHHQLSMHAMQLCTWNYSSQHRMLCACMTGQLFVSMYQLLSILERFMYDQRDDK